MPPCCCPREKTQQEATNISGIFRDHGWVKDMNGWLRFITTWKKRQLVQSSTFADSEPSRQNMYIPYIDSNAGFPNDEKMLEKWRITSSQSKESIGIPYRFPKWYRFPEKKTMVTCRITMKSPSNHSTSRSVRSPPSRSRRSPRSPRGSVRPHAAPRPPARRFHGSRAWPNSDLSGANITGDMIRTHYRYDIEHTSIYIYIYTFNHI